MCGLEVSTFVKIFMSNFNDFAAYVQGTFRQSETNLIRSEALGSPVRGCA